jgi:centromere/kinetochore protein ZW10
MSGQLSEQEIFKAVLDFATEGTYPESEQVVAAEFPLSAVSKELELITQARDKVEVSTVTKVAPVSLVIFGGPMLIALS